MRKCLVINNMISNGGDHLITNCGYSIVKQELSMFECKYINLYSESFNEDEILSYDLVIYIGGPAYTNRLLEESLYPLYDIIKNSEIPLYMLGCGWYGTTDASFYVENYKFSERSLEVLRYINKYGLLGCRDNLSVNVLKNNNLDNYIMTGCPVWYRSLNDKVQLRKNINKIIISDMGITKLVEEQSEKYIQMEKLLIYLKDRFMDNELYFTFNNGIDTKYSSSFNNKVRNLLDNLSIKYFDLSNDYEGFSIYDSMDFHVGYRLHSHLYCLSMGIPSVLISEDARGLGTSETFQMTKIYSNLSEEDGYKPNNNLTEELNSEISKVLENREKITSDINTFVRTHYENNIKVFFDKIKV